MFDSCITLSGGIYPFEAYIIASVVFLSETTILFIYHSGGTYILYSSRIFSTVYPELFLRFLS